MNAPSIHHLHFNAERPLEAANWYAEQFGMKAIEVASDPQLCAAVHPGADQLAPFTHLPFTQLPFTHLPFTLLWSHVDNVEGSVGSTLDHFGLSVVDLDADTERLVAAGCELVGEPVTIGPSSTGETLRISFLLDPFGAKLELVADADLLGFHHVHLLSTNVEADQAQWINLFGGSAQVFKGFLPGIRYANGWVLFRASEQPLEPTAGRAIDHLAFSTDSTAGELARLSEQGMKVTAAQPSHGGRTVGFAHISTGATGAVTVEVVEEPRRPDAVAT